LTIPPAHIRRLEDISADAWPAAATERLYGWRLGFTRGVTRRANSVLPNRWDGPSEPDAAVAEVERRYRSRGLRPCFKLTAAALPAGLDDILAARGYRAEGWTDVHTADCDAVPVADRGAVRLLDVPTPEWIATCWSERDPRSEVPVLTELIHRIATPRVFALAVRDGAAAGGGLAIRVGDWAGITAVTTLPQFRRGGVARTVVAALTRWGRAQGVSSLYIQVEADNQPARHLYPPLGFRPAYRYHYRAG